MKILQEDGGYEYRQWYVQGTRWNGMVTKIDNQAFTCDCTQYKKHKICQHIGFVKRKLGN